MRKSQAMSAGSMQKKPWGSDNPPTTSCSQHVVAAPTTFVQADTNSFRELVQKLTGASDDAQEKKLPVTMPARYANRNSGEDGSFEKPNSECGGLSLNKSSIEVGPRKTAFKPHEKRPCARKLDIKLALTSLRQNPNPSASPYKSSPIDDAIQSPTLPALLPSPVTPLELDLFTSALCHGHTQYSPATPCNVSSPSAVSGEEQAVAEKGFDLHPLPRPGPRSSEPELLPLFPLHSPRGSSS